MNGFQNLEQIRRFYNRYRNDQESLLRIPVPEWIEARKEAYIRFRNDFAPENLENLTVHQFHNFLNFRTNLSWTGLQSGAELLTRAKNDGQLSDDDIKMLAKLVNKSLVGASKLLHFTAPNAFAIWDSKIYLFVFEEKPHNYRVNQLDKYREYMLRLGEIRRRPGFEEFHEAVQLKVGYEISALRAIELVMFLNSG